MQKNTIIDLWNALTDIPVVINEEGVTVIDDPDGFMGWPYGTDVETIWRWFDDQFAKWGGVHVLMYDHPAPERRFQVETPAGIIECYAKHDTDTPADYPGVFIDIRRTNPQLTGEEIGNIACCVEYDSGEKRLQTVVHTLSEMDTAEQPSHVDSVEEPVFIERYAPLTTFQEFMAKFKDELLMLDMWDIDGNEIPGDCVIPDTAKVLQWSRLGDSYFEVTLDMHVEDLQSNRIPERISKDMIRRGLTDGVIDIDDCDQGGYAALIGDHWFYFDDPNDDICAEAHKDTTDFEDDVEAIWRAINAEPINGVTEDDAAECLYYLAYLTECFAKADAAFADKPLIQYPLAAQIDACYKYLNWQHTHKNPYNMTEAELHEAQMELDACVPGIAWVAHAGYAQMVPQDKETGKLIVFGGLLLS